VYSGREREVPDRNPNPGQVDKLLAKGVEIHAR
jgi:hypothetical protein